MNLIPNGGFETGLSEWESTPSGVTFVKTEAKRFVMLAAERHIAAICSDPFDVIPGAAYEAHVERAVRGECEVAVIGAHSVLKPDSHGEVIARESPVRVQVTARPGQRLGVARVSLTPIGHRARIMNMRSTAAFAYKDEPFQILCEIANTGSEPIPGVARLVSERHYLIEDHKQELRVPAIPLGESADLSWLVGGQRSALAPYLIEFEHAGGVIKAEGTTLRHVPRLPEKQVMQSVAGGRRFFTVSSRGLRVTAHETDLDYGPMLLSDDRGREGYGVIQQLAQVVPYSGGAIPLWSQLRQVSAAGVELAGANDQLAWKIAVRPDHRAKGIALEVKLNARRRLSDVNVEIAPFQTNLPLRSEGGAAVIGKDLRLAWTGEGFEQRVSERGGMLALRSGRMTLIPGSMFRAVGVVHKAEAGIVRG